MHKNQFRQLLKERVLILDGSYGTEFFKRGYGNVPGVVLNISTPEIVGQLQKEYVDAGSDIILANTFSANRPKLSALGYDKEFKEINQRGVEIAHRASNGKALVFGNLSSLGNYPEPIGTMDFEESVEAFSEQAVVLKSAGVDGFMVETMTDIKELKAAILGIRSVTDYLPIIAQMTFDSSLRTVTGSSVKVFATMLEDLDVDVLGLNCTLGPDAMFPLFKELASYTTKFLSLEPNAGEPLYDGSNLHYKMSPEHFAMYLEDYLDLGANIVGGCCGTSPAHINVIHNIISHRRPIQREVNFTQALTSRTIYRPQEPFTIIGERINPASRKEFQHEIVNGDFRTVLREASDQEKEGATVLDINLGIEKLLTIDHFKRVILELDRHSSLPLSLDIQTDEYLEIAMRESPGRVLINSCQVTEKSLEKGITLLKKYGGMLVLLAMNSSIPETAEERFRVALEGISILEANNISRDRVLVDPLILPLGAGKNPKVALETIRLLSAAGFNTIMGLSNLSFGLSNRSQVNGAFLAQAISNGVNSAIMNTNDPFVMGCLKGALTLVGDSLFKEETIVSDNLVTDALLTGDKEKVKNLVDEELKFASPMEVSQKFVGKAMEQIGHLFDQSKIYLPHLLLANSSACF